MRVQTGRTDRMPYTDAQLAVIGQARDTLLACDMVIRSKAPGPETRWGYLGYINDPYLAFRNCLDGTRPVSAEYCNPGKYLGKIRYQNMLAAIDTLKQLRIKGALYGSYAPYRFDLILIIDTNYHNHGDGRFLATHSQAWLDVQDKRGNFLYLRDQFP